MTKNNNTSTDGWITQTWVQATPKQMVRMLNHDLIRTPFWKPLKRLELKRVIKYWESQV